MEKYGTARQATDDNIMLFMRFAYWIPKATDKHLEYVILNACPLQQWLHESTSMLSYTYSVCSVSNQTGTVACPATDTGCTCGLSSHRYRVYLWLSPRGKGDLSKKLTTYSFMIMTYYLINYNEGFTFYLRVKPVSARDGWLHLQLIFFKFDVCVSVHHI